MIHVKFWIGNDYENIKNIELSMRQVPSKGDNVQFPFGYVKYEDGTPYSENTFEVDFITWQLFESNNEITVQMWVANVFLKK